MPIFVADMRTIHHEVWEVEAADEADARRKIREMHEDVIDDETGGEIVDYKIQSIRKGRE